MRQGRVLPTQTVVVTKKSLHTLEDISSGIQVGNDEQVTI